MAFIVTYRKPATESGVPGPIIEQIAIPDEPQLTQIVVVEEELTFIFADGAEKTIYDIPDEWVTVTQSGATREATNGH
jgi:hypothetical protein